MVCTLGQLSQLKAQGRWRMTIALGQLAAAAIGALVTSASPGHAQSEPHRPIDPAALANFVDGMARDAMTADHIAGAAVAIVQDGRPVLVRGYGFASFDPPRAVDAEQTLFRIGSVSKTFIWIALMQQVERQRMRLDAPVDDYLPRDLHSPAQGFQKPIRLLDLMGHTSGFEDRDLGASFLIDPAKMIPLVEFLAKHRPARVREPGPPSAYSNYGASLAAAAVAHVTGQDFETVVEREISGPLQMNSTTFRQPHPPDQRLPTPMSDELAARLATGFRWTGSGFEPRRLELIARPSGPASASVRDMATYMLMQLNDGTLDGVTLYGRETAAAFRTPIVSVPAGINGWAHGFNTRALPGGFTSYGHGGGTLSFFSNMFLVPELRLGIFVVTNTDTGQAFVSRFPEKIVAQFYSTALDSWRRGDPDLTRHAAVYGGDYLSTRRAYSGLKEFWGRWLEAARVSVTADGYLVTQSGGTARRWVPTQTRGQFQAADGPQTLLFEFDEQGRGVRWITPTGAQAFERVSALQSPGTLRQLGWLALVVAAINCLIILARVRGCGRSRLAAEATIFGASMAWLVAGLAFYLWLSKSADPVNWFFDFPGPLLSFASMTALLATAASVSMLALLVPFIWRRATRAEESIGAFTAIRCAGSAFIYLSLAAVLASWGALAPWH